MNTDELASSVANPVYYVEYEDSRWYAPSRHSRRCFLLKSDALFFQKYKIVVERRMATISEVSYES